MSAYSDWKVGAISDSEYRDICQYEARRDRYFEELELREQEEGVCDEEE